MLSSFIFVCLNLGPWYSSIFSDCIARLSSLYYKHQGPLKMCFNQLLETFSAVDGRYLAFSCSFMHQAKLFTGIKKSTDKLFSLILWNIDCNIIWVFKTVFKTLAWMLPPAWGQQTDPEARTLVTSLARFTVSGGSSVSAQPRAYWGGHRAPIKLAYVGNGMHC